MTSKTILSKKSLKKIIILYILMCIVEWFFDTIEHITEYQKEKFYFTFLYKFAILIRLFSNPTFLSVMKAIQKFTCINSYLLTYTKQIKVTCLSVILWNAFYM